MSQDGITFHLADIEVSPISGKEDMYQHWLIKVAQQEGKTIASLTYIFCSDEYLLDINIKYLGHDYYTDIITFPYIDGENIEADLYISVERVHENAEIFNVCFEEELRRVMVHGLLHMLGYKDKSEEDISLMRDKEDNYITKFR